MSVQCQECGYCPQDAINCAGCGGNFTMRKRPPLPDHAADLALAEAVRAACLDEIGGHDVSVCREDVQAIDLPALVRRVREGKP